ncbi:MAG: YraN family protein [Brevinematia bacterium]
MQLSEIAKRKDKIISRILKTHNISINELREILTSYLEGINLSWMIVEKFGLEKKVENWFIFSQTLLNYVLKNKFHCYLNIGRETELKGCRYLSSLGFSIISLNYHSRNGEVDIICYDGKSIRFVEVKSTFSKFIPEEKLSKGKANKILTVSEDFISEIDYQDVGYDALVLSEGIFKYYKDYLV